MAGDTRIKQGGDRAGIRGPLIVLVQLEVGQVVRSLETWICSGGLSSRGHVHQAIVDGHDLREGGILIQRLHFHLR